MDISGRTRVIAHIGFPTESFKAPLIYNPWFEQCGADAVVVPMGCKADDFAAFLPLVFRLSNVGGALITMPHKVVTCGLVDRLSPVARIAGACNAVRRAPDGALEGDMFDGEGFVRGVRGKGVTLQGARALVVGCGGVGCAIAASLAAAGVGLLQLADVNAQSVQALGQRSQTHYPHIALQLGSNDPLGMDLVVNATPLGMNPNDPMPVDVSRLQAHCFVGEVVMAQEVTAFLAAAQARGCRTQVGADMLFEQIPAYLEYFGFPSTSADNLRRLARLHY